MGGHPYFYFVPYQADTQRALDELRDREFQAGRYNPVLPFIEFEPDQLLSQQPGRQHSSIREALEASDADGTRSILDIQSVGAEMDYGVSAPFPSELVASACGSDKPQRDRVWRGLSDLLEVVPRGQSGYLVVYNGDTPAELLFCGYSYD